jgi:hypothetical protein
LGAGALARARAAGRDSGDSAPLAALAAQHAGGPAVADALSAHELRLR